MSEDELREAIHQSLDQMRENGYWDAGSDPMIHWSDADIAGDLIAFDCECSHYEPSDLLSHVQSWRAAQQKDAAP